MATPKWLKSKYQLKKEIKRRFIAEIKKEIQQEQKEEEDRFLYGDPEGIKPSGTISYFKQDYKRGCGMCGVMGGDHIKQCPRSK